MNMLIKMSNFRENRQCITYAYRKGFINNRQCVLLYDANTSKKPGLSILEVWSIWFGWAGKWPVQGWIPILQKWHFQTCWISSITRWDCYLQQPSSWISSCFMYLSQVLYVSLPLWDMVSHFARPVPELCIITNHMIDWIYNWWHHLLSRYNRDLLSPANLMF